MRRLLRISLLAVLAMAVEGAVFPSDLLPATAAYAQGWRAEFDGICQKTADPMSLEKDELKRLISRCDKLRTVMETLDESERKIYLKRLRACQGLFVFVIESKEKE